MTLLCRFASNAVSDKERLYVKSSAILFLQRLICAPIIMLVQSRISSLVRSVDALELEAYRLCHKDIHTWRRHRPYSTYIIFFNIVRNGFHIIGMVPAFQVYRDATCAV